MSEVYKHRLEIIRDERNATRDALRYIAGNWDRKEIIEAVTPKTQETFRKTLRNLDTTFFIRLTV